MKRYWSFVALLVFIAACSNSTGPGTTSGTILNGALSGVVKVGDEFQGSHPNDSANSAGVIVHLENTTLFTVTDSTGRWGFQNVPAGTYDVSVSRQNCGLIRAYGVSVAGPGNSYLPAMRLGALPELSPKLDWGRAISKIYSYYADSATLVTDTVPVVQVHWTAPYSRSYFGLTVFVDTTANVAPADVHKYTTADLTYMWEGWYSGWTDDTTAGSTENKGVLNCRLSDLYKAGFHSGEKVYLSLAQWDPYPINGEHPFDKQWYYDPVHNQNRIISPSPRSNVIEVDLP